jgi:putative heme iron utilization protein
VNDDERLRLHRLLSDQRWAALASLGENGAPSVSFVAYVPEQDFSGFLIHVSRLAAHTRNLLERPRVALGISAPDDGRGDPQLLERITLHGAVSEIPRGTPDYLAARARYVARLPQSEQLFGFADFVLMRLRPEEARYVGGFARAFTLRTEQLLLLAEP